ncbi:uncharacterized protein LOC114428586 [Parambassis ranga]|uniref:Uncharacterized protein LOC114428586 n=1 Tax=Parambassis ranga TaxID=210632 RepID=A0A6P7HG43_9TELE|nr:uncharacterized protein LOC114428586 [Parambassis ranga]XP_028252943.1 uncharacterized protein LOC114428586 [Parambassis ranga]
MLDFRWIQMSSCLLLVLHFTVTAGQTSVLKRGGEDVTLSCEKVIDDQNNCDGTTWVYSPLRVGQATELIRLGQINEDIPNKDRLSVTENCSLIIKKVREEDAGQYVCQQYKKEEQPYTRVHVSQVDLSVVIMTESNNPDQVYLICSVVSYNLCSHTVRWLFNGEDLDGLQSDILITESECSNILKFLDQINFVYKSQNLLKCEVTDYKTGKVQQFDFNHQTSGDSQTATTEHPPTTENKGPDQSLLKSIIVSVGLAALIITAVTVCLWTRAKGTQRQKDEGRVYSDEDEGAVDYENITESSV